jgi:hypothetical protein
MTPNHETCARKESGKERKKRSVDGGSEVEGERKTGRDRKEREKGRSRKMRKVASEERIYGQDGMNATRRVAIAGESIVLVLHCQKFEAL